MSGDFKGPRYLNTAEELLSEEVGAVHLGQLISGQEEELWDRMFAECDQRGIARPRMIAHLVFKKGFKSAFGIETEGVESQPYRMVKGEHEELVEDCSVFCGENIPDVYLVDGSRFTASHSF